MPETCRVLQQNKIGIISASGWLFKKKSITMHGNMNVKFDNVDVGKGYNDCVGLSYEETTPTCWQKGDVWDVSKESEAKKNVSDTDLTQLHIVQIVLSSPLWKASHIFNRRVSVQPSLYQYRHTILTVNSTPIITAWNTETNKSEIRTYSYIRYQSHTICY